MMLLLDLHEACIVNSPLVQKISCSRFICEGIVFCEAVSAIFIAAFSFLNEIEQLRKFWTARRERKKIWQDLYSPIQVGPICMR